MPGKMGLELLELEHRARYEAVHLLAEDKRVLDLGSGSGYGAARMAEVAASVVGVERSAEAVEFARGVFGRDNMELLVGDVLAVDTIEELFKRRPEGFDIITCFELIEHLESPARLAEKVGTLLAPEGIAFISTPNLLRRQPTNERDNPYHVLEFDRRQYALLLREHFAHVEVLEQTVHLATRIRREGREAGAFSHWPLETATEPKFFIAVCSNRPIRDQEVEGLLLLTGEEHLFVLRDRLEDLRRDRTIRGERIEALREQAGLLRARVAELEGERNRGSTAIGRTSSVEPVDPGLTRLEAEVEHQTRATQEAEQRLVTIGEKLSLRDERLQLLRALVKERSAAFEKLLQQIAILNREREESENKRAEAEEALHRETRRAGDLAAQCAEQERRILELEASQVESRSRIAVLEARQARLQPADDGVTRRHSVPGTEEPVGSPVENQAAVPDASSSATSQALVRRLAAELHHILTSRRWRLAQFLVRIRNAFLRRTEAASLDFHLLGLFRAARRPLPAALSAPLKDGLPTTYVRLVCYPPRRGTEMRILSEDQKEQWRRWLLQRPQNQMVSVILPTWNRVETLDEAILSVLAQSYRNLELLVVDDGSEDGTEALVRRRATQDSRLHYHRMEHQGVSAARDHGLQHSKGAVIAYLDSDNSWDPDHLLFLLHALVESDRSCAYGILRVVDHDRRGEVSYRRRLYSRRALLRNNYIDINVFVHRRELFETLGGFDRELRRWVDWDLILRYTEHHPPAQVPVALCDYRRSKALRQITNEESRAYKFRVLHKHLIDWQDLASRQASRRPGHASIIVLNYRLPDLTRKCLESILRNTRHPHYDVILVDNGSRDRSGRKLQRLARRYENVSFLANYENYGFSLGNNLGVAVSRGEFLVLLNNDIEVHEGWLEPLLSPLREDPEIGAVGPRMLYPDGTLQQGGMAFCHLSRIPFHLYQDEPGDAPHVNIQRKFQSIGGACLAVRAADWIELRGLEPLFLNGGEDLDFCFRMRLELGKELLYNPRSSMIHYAGQSPGRSQHIMYNRRLFAERWGDRVIADDHVFFSQDGFRVVEYVKKGPEADGEFAIYTPVLQPVDGSHFSRRDGRKVRQVGLVSTWYVRGVSYVAKALAEALDGSGRFRSHVLARWESERFSNAGSIHHPRVLDGGDDPTPQEVLDWAGERDLDLVIFVEVHPKDWERVRALRQKGIPVLAYEHLDVLRLDMLERYQEVDGFVSSTFHGWRELKGHFPEKSCLLVPWGVKLDEEEARELHGEGDYSSKQGLTFVHVAGWGGLDQRKNTGLLVRSFAEAGVPGALLRIYTQAPLASYGEEAVHLAENNPDIVVHEGTLPDISVAYRECDMLLWPSKREGLGLPIVEALSRGLPVLISNGWMMKEWPVVGEHAILCAASPRPGDEAAPRYLPPLDVNKADLVQRLRELGSDPERVRRLAENVRRDRSHWIWSWQGEAFARQVDWWLEGTPGDRDETRFLPDHILRFEERRQRARSGFEIESPTPPDSAVVPVTEPIAAVPAQPRTLFIAGCQRSGTTAMVFLLNSDPRLVIGRERYKFCRRDLGAKHFTEARFFALRKDETNFRDPGFYDPLRERWRSGGLRWVGDKVPFYYKDLPLLDSRFPKGRFLFLIRDLHRVAASYNARAANPEDRVWKATMDYRQAARDWNESLEKAVEYLNSKSGDRMFVVHYERFFAGEEEYLEALFQFLDLPLLDEVRQRFAEMTAGWARRSRRRLGLSGEMIAHLEEHRRRDLEEEVLSRVPAPPLTAGRIGATHHE